MPNIPRPIPCKHDYVKVWSLETVVQDYNLEKQDWDSTSEGVEILSLIEAQCQGCKEDVTMEIGAATGMRILHPDNPDDMAIIAKAIRKEQ